MTVAQQTPGVCRSSGNLYEVLDLILDKGLVIDVFARVSLVGIEILTVDVRIVVASVDTYLRFAEACNRLDLTHSGGAGLPDLLGGGVEKGARSKSKGALSGAAEALSESFSKGRDVEEDAPQPVRPRGTSSRTGKAGRQEKEG
jgi:hypothetical protein